MSKTMLLLTSSLFAWVMLGVALAQPPAPDSSGTVRASEVPFFSKESHALVGNKGEETLDVSTRPGACGEPNWVFDSVDLVVHKRRFGDVQFVSMPVAGCLQCSPLIVRWFHEPTGYLAFDINLNRRRVVTQCGHASQQGIAPNDPT